MKTSRKTLSLLGRKREFTESECASAVSGVCLRPLRQNVNNFNLTPTTTINESRK